ncbi:MAG TPA: TAXI family TRAP transporter solute-binding subunit, partial [Xanthobacteraceae bacterium]|nr:TAXI family TRAP transporter solute-binding subunit [Xanthobacteraceae bacterium]
DTRRRISGRSYLELDRFRVVILLVIVAGVCAAFLLLPSLPPRTIVMATGPDGGAYAELGQRYREILGRSGIDVKLLPTGGDFANLAQLRDPHSGVSVGFIQGGSTTPAESPGLVSLGAVFYEPLWLFHQRELDLDGVNGLRGRKVSIGAEGSGSRVLSLELLRRNGMTQDMFVPLALSPEEAGRKLLNKEIDAAFILTSWDSMVIRQLLAAETIELASFPRADAYVALYPFLNKLVVPAGVGDLATNRPASDKTLLAPKVSLAVRKDVHPAIQYALLSAAAQIHAEPGIFQRAGQFPAAEPLGLPLSDEAQRFHKSGRPFLQHHLPFWMAVLVERLLVVLIPVVGLLYPLVRFIPALYDWSMRSKIFRLYGEMRFLELQIERGDAKHDLDATTAQLDRIEERAHQLKMPKAYASMLYSLLGHIALVRERLKKDQSSPLIGS